MRSYGLYMVLLVLILIAAAYSWGDTRATVMYGIALAGLAGLVLMKVLESKRLGKVKGPESPN